MAECSPNVKRDVRPGPRRALGTATPPGVERDAVGQGGRQHACRSGSVPNAFTVNQLAPAGAEQEPSVLRRLCNSV